MVIASTGGTPLGVNAFLEMGVGESEFTQMCETNTFLAQHIIRPSNHEQPKTASKLTMAVVRVTDHESPESRSIQHFTLSE